MSRAPDEPPADAPLKAGARLGAYVIESVIGEGGMGAVYAGRHAHTDSPVALKVMHEHETHGEEQRRRFYREARAAAALAHPNVVRVYEAFEDRGRHALVMERLRGRTLAKHLEGGGRLDVLETARILLPVVSALGYAHALGVVHRDVKPENIFLTQEGPKLLDFGLVKLTYQDGPMAQSVALTKAGALLGTPFYMSPEQACSEPHIDHRSDMWSLGIVAYRCLSGVLPTDGATLARVMKKILRDPIAPLDEATPGVPKELSDHIARMLMKDRAARPKDLLDTYQLLARCGGGSAPAFGESRVAIRVNDGRPSDPPPSGEPSGAPGDDLAATVNLRGR